MNFEIGNKVRALADDDGIDKLDMTIPYEIFNFIDYENRIGIKNGRHWYYLKPNELEHWKD